MSPSKIRLRYRMFVLPQTVCLIDFKVSAGKKIVEHGYCAMRTIVHRHNTTRYLQGKSASIIGCRLPLVPGTVPVMSCTSKRVSCNFTAPVKGAPLDQSCKSAFRIANGDKKQVNNLISDVATYPTDGWSPDPSGPLCLRVLQQIISLWNHLQKQFGPGRAALDAARPV